MQNQRISTVFNQQAESRRSQQIKLDTFNNKVINNYEIVDYDPSGAKIKEGFQHTQAPYDANTFDIYSYNDAAFVYQEEVYAQQEAMNHSPPLPPPPPNISSSIAVSNVIAPPPRPLSATPVCIPPSESKLVPNKEENTLNNIYNASSNYSVKYLIDINDLKNHFTLSQANMIESNKQNTMSTRMSVVGSNQPLDSETTSTMMRKKSHRISSISYTSPADVFCCFCCGCFKTFKCFAKCLTCLNSCCFRPCCSMAGILFVLVALVCMLAAVLCMTVFGVIQVPNEITQTICNATHEKNNYFYHQNFTIIREIEKKRDNVSNETRISSQREELAAAKLKKIKIANEIRRESLTSLKKKLASSLKVVNKYKNRVARFSPIQYDVWVKMSTTQTETKRHNIQAKVGLSVELYCNLSTSSVLFSAKEFVNIEVSMKRLNQSENLVKKWNFDSSTDTLEVEMKQNCTNQSVYVLNMVIDYKSYGKGYLYDKTLKDMKSFHLLGFNQAMENPFPVVIDSFDINPQTRKYSTILAGPSVFNLTMIKPRSMLKNIIFNTELFSKAEFDGLEYIRFKPTRFVRPQTLGLIIASTICNEMLLETSVKMCSTNLKDIYGDDFHLIATYLPGLLNFYSNYTNRKYPADKIEIVVLPSENVIDLVNTDFQMTHHGIIYLASSYFNRYMTSNDDLTKSQNNFKLLNMLAKQLAKHWFYDSYDLNCEKNFILQSSRTLDNWHGEDMTDQSDILADTVDMVKSFSEYNFNFRHNNQSGKDLLDKSVSVYLELNEKCFLFKGVINWISYMAFQSVQTETAYQLSTHNYLFDLVHLEWSLIKDVDETYFLANKNLNHIYQTYEFPHLAENNNFQKIKTEMKSLISVKAIFHLLGKEKFQRILTDWFKLTDLKWPNEVNKTSRVSRFVEINNAARLRTNQSLLNILEQCVVQYNLLPFDNLSIREVLRSWILAENDIVVTIERNYNKKEALITRSQQSSLVNFYYPLNLYYGTSRAKSTDNTRFIQSNSNLFWLNQTAYRLKFQPGADKWIIGNYMQLFHLLRVNYDKENWNMLAKQFLYDHKAIGVEERAQIIDDTFYLINNQILKIQNGLNLIEYLPNERSYLPWKFAVDNIRKIMRYVEDDSQIYSKFRKYIIELLKPIYHTLKWGQDSQDTLDDKFVRILVVDLLCSLDYENCVENSVKQLSDSIKISVYNIPQYLSKSVYCTAIRHSGINEWQFLWKYYLEQASDNTNMKDSLLYSLSCSSQIWILNMLFRKLVYENAVAPSDLPIALGYISQNPTGRYIIWNHISQNYQTFYNKIGNDPELFVKILQVSTKEFKFKYEIKQIHDFIEEIGVKNYSIYYNVDLKSKNSNENLFSNIESRISAFTKWKEANSLDLDDWLTKQETEKPIF